MWFVWKKAQEPSDLVLCFHCERLGHVPCGQCFCTGDLVFTSHSPYFPCVPECLSWNTWFQSRNHDSHRLLESSVWALSYASLYHHYTITWGGFCKAFKPFSSAGKLRPGFLRGAWILVKLNQSKLTVFSVFSDISSFFYLSFILLIIWCELPLYCIQGVARCSSDVTHLYQWKVMPSY